MKARKEEIVADNDLISRKEALERLEILRKFNQAEPMQIVIDAAEQQIKFCDAVFDKDKVVEELKKCSYEIWPYIDKDHYCLLKVVVDLKKAIEIIEQISRG